MSADSKQLDRAVELVARLQRPALVVVIALMAVAAGVRLYQDIPRLLVDHGPYGAIDLIHHHREAWAWFNGGQVHNIFNSAADPPATCLLLWPLVVGPGEAAGPRWVWLLVNAPLLCCLVALIWRLAAAGSLQWRVLITLTIVSGYAASTTIGNGQITFLALAPLLGALALLERPSRSWTRDLLISALFLVALVKPSLSAPFFLLVLVAPRGARPAIFIVLGYAALTLIATLFRDAGVVSVLREWVMWYMEASEDGAARVSSTNLVSWLVAADQRYYAYSASLLVLAVSVIWAYRYRFADRALLIGALAIISRIWTYHGVYDDLIVVLSMAVLLRVAASPRRELRTAALSAVLLALAWATSLIPARWLLDQSRWGASWSGAQSAIWIAALVFFMVLIHRDDRARRALPGAPGANAST